MNETDRPHLPHVPTLTEVIEPIHLDTEDQPASPSASVDDAPHMILSRNMPSHDSPHTWTPITTLVLDDHVGDVAGQADSGQPPPDLANLPLLTEPVLTSEVVAAMPHMKSAELSQDQVVQRVMTDVQRSIDSMLEFRLKQALEPVLARHAEAIARHLRDELSQTMRDVVTRAVAQELAKLRQR